MNRFASIAALVAALALPVAGLSFAGLSASADASGLSQPSRSEAARTPELVLVKFHADWCPNCRALNAPFASLTEELAEKGVLFVKLDRTDKADATQAEYHLASLGLGDHWAAFGKRTGLVVLFDPATKRVVREFTAKDNADTIRRVINENLG